MTKAETATAHDTMALLQEMSVQLHAEPDLDAVLSRAIAFARRLRADACEIYLQSDSGELYFKSSQPTPEPLTPSALQTLVHSTLAQGVAAEALKSGQAVQVKDTTSDRRWKSSSPFFQTNRRSNGQVIPTRSLVCAPIMIADYPLRGVIAVFHSQPNQFDEQSLAFLQLFATQIAIALKNTIRVGELQHNLHETQLILDMSRRLAEASSLKEVYMAAAQRLREVGADRCSLHICDMLDANNVPTQSEVVAVDDADQATSNQGVGHTISIKEYPTLVQLLFSQEMSIIEDTNASKRLTRNERIFFQRFGIQSLLIMPLISRMRVMGLVFIEFRNKHVFSERELLLYRTLGHHTILAIERAEQIKQTESALAETQTLYRAGRVLAGAADLQEILQEALVEYVYSLGLDQGGVTLVSPDRQYGQLMAYVQDGQLQNVEKLKFPLDTTVTYQQILLSGRPFVSEDAANDPKLTGFRSFNKKGMPKSLLEAPMIIRGETIGWIGADAVKQKRHFTQQEIDLARAMADQIAITLQNRRLLEQTERRATRLKTVAQVGEFVSGMIDLNEIFATTVELIRDRFGFYHVSIFLLDQTREWAVVHASTGEVGKIMVSKPHRLQVGSNSIVGYVTAHAQPRIALDVDEDKVHFQNPLLPHTRSEMALPLLSRGIVIGALDVQSTEINAFSDEDIDTLQIMADQLAHAIENARLLRNAQDSQNFLNSIIDNIPTPIFVKEAANLRFIRWNRASEQLFGLSQKEMLNKTDYDLFPQEEADFFVTKDRDVLTSGQLLDIPEEVIHTPSGMHLLHTRKIPVLDAEGHPRYLLGISEDITQQKQVEAALQANQRFLQDVLDNTPASIYVLDTQGRFMLINRYFADLFGLDKNQVIGKTDMEIFPQDMAEAYHQADLALLNSGATVQLEEQLTRADGIRTFISLKFPLFDGEGKPYALCGIATDITDRKQAEEILHETFAKTQSLYRISGALATATDQQAAAELVLGEYLRLLNLKQGTILLLDKAGHMHQARALYDNGEATAPVLSIPAKEDAILQHLQQNQAPLVVDDTQTHPLSQQMQHNFRDAQALLALPLVLRDKVAGVLLVTSTEKGYAFSESDIKIGQAIADQLGIWLENRQLLDEARYRSELLQTAAEVSRAASSILDMNELINTSVNLIRDHFDFYYVGLFMVDEARTWAVLRAGTGEAGRLQLQNGHKLKIGSNSMIGWCIENQQARIALDVGQEAVRFHNPYLPDTHSEMALPLISRKEAIGALTVQSVEQSAFSDEDITLLQTMADQLANAIENASLFEQTQQALAETESLYQITQDLLSAPDEEAVYQLALKAVSHSGADTVTIYLVENTAEAEATEQVLEQKAAWTATGQPAFPNGTHFRAHELIFEQLIPHEPLLIEDVTRHSPYLTEQLRQILQQTGVKSLVALPLSTSQGRLGFLVVTYKMEEKRFSPQQIRFFNTIARQMVTALENLRLLSASQRRLRREEIIREITGKIRKATTVEDILKTTVTELGKVVGASQGGITLGVKSPAPVAKLPAPEES